MMDKVSKENIESYINDTLKEEIKRLDQYIQAYNEEIMEFVQLKNSIEALQKKGGEKLKTQMNIGGRCFMKAEVQNTDKIIIDVGKSCFVEFTMVEAIKFLNFKITVLTKECQVIRDESIKQRSNVKLTMVLS
ncbi:protein UXT homolog [Episyrphus balteatus]|uniref:protein UXT homolog n=1 Tax=Episyrphus balteatus TaxID=286459 RepID=UPI002486063A|nr:protein UXT homolog [Episyrphus balteatus]